MARGQPTAEQLRSRAEWEAMKARGRNLTPADAVREVAELTDLYRRMWRPMTPVHIELRKIVQTLNAKKIPFVLTGAHGISTWTGRPRSTHDIDILVKSGRNLTRAVNAIKSLYPELEVREHFGDTSFFIPGEVESVIDVTYPHHPDIEETLRTAVQFEDEGQKYRIPTLEAALANKYGAMLTLSRDPIKRAQDAVDFYQMMKHSLDANRQPINLEVLQVLGEKVWPDGGGEEILRLVQGVKEGKVPNPLQLRQNGA